VDEVGGAHAVIARELGVFLRHFVRMQNQRTASGGLDRAAYHLLGRLADGGPGRLSTLAAHLHLDLSVVSRQAAALEAAGLVARTPDPADRRASVIAATEAGHRFLSQKREHFEALLRVLLADWTPSERAEFARLMGRFNGALTAHEEGK
jgi:DNA-binding MarR family transcriptional regulator